MSARGQATIELALGSLLTITLIFGALYFGELTFIGMKLTEAGTFNAMDASALRLTDYENPSSIGKIYQPAKGAVARLKKNSKHNERYLDLDGTTDGTGIALGWTGTSNVLNHCERDEQFSFRVPKHGQRFKRVKGDAMPKDNYFDDVQDRVRNLYRSDPSDGPMGGFACSARADVASLNIPTNMLERGGSNGFFKVQHWATAPVRLCAFGRSKGGQCGELGIVIGDWALEGEDGSPLNRSVSLRHKTSGNVPYRRIVRSIIEANGPGKDPVSRGRAASKMVRWVTWEASPYDESEFKMSFAGIDNNKKSPYLDYPAGKNGEEYEDVTAGVYDPRREGTSLTAKGKKKKGKDPNRLRVRGSCFLGFGKQGVDECGQAQ